jgi:hypothetical protein
MNNKSIAVAIATGRQIIRDEHAFFVNVGVDNSEHVPRIERIAESIRSILSQEGSASSEANQAKRDLIDFGRALFVKEWMIPIEGEDEIPSEEEAVAESANRRVSSRLAPALARFLTTGPQRHLLHSLKPKERGRRCDIQMSSLAPHDRDLRAAPRIGPTGLSSHWSFGDQSET